MALGAAPFALLVWQRAYRVFAADAASDAGPAADERMTRVLRQLMFYGGIAFLLTNLFLAHTGGGGG